MCQCGFVHVEYSVQNSMPEEEVKSPEAEVTGGSELSDMGPLKSSILL